MVTFALDMMYFDHSATTPIDSRVLDLMNKTAKLYYGNPSSIHKQGQKARAIIEKARRQVADALNVKSRNIIFTGGGTEANNLVLRNVLYGNKKHVITSAIEHPAILKVLNDLIKFGVEHTVVPVDRYGTVKLDKLKSSIQENTGLITIMYANNEVGTVQQIAEIAKFAKANNIPFHTDAVQTPGKVSINIQDMNVDMASFSAHKFYGPKGVGFLYLGDNIKLHPLIIGGGQEKRLRAGTENTSGIAALGLALELVNDNLKESSRHLTKLENYFKENFNSIYPDAIYNGNTENHLPGLVSVTIPAVTSDILLVNLDMKGIAVSSGSACSSGNVKPSSVLSSMNINNKHNISTLRISFGKENTIEEIDVLVSTLGEILNKYKKSNG